MKPLYSVGTWDHELQEFSPQKGLYCKSINISIGSLRKVMRKLRSMGFPCNYNKEDEDNDPSVIIERTDGMHREIILEGWRR